MTNRSDPMARGVIVASFALALYATFAAPGAAVPPVQAEQIIVIATPTLGVPAPAPEAAPDQALVRAALPTPVADAPAPAAEPPAVVVNEESRAAEHSLPPIQPAPPAAQEPKAGDVLIQASTGPEFQQALSGEGSKPGKAWKP